jgi:hypothetical protein
MRLLRRNKTRSMTKPTAMTDARIKNQIGQPAASTIANTRVLQMCLNYQGATVACDSRLSNISHLLREEFLANSPFEKGISVYPQNLWITLWMNRGGLALKWRGLSVFVTLPIFCRLKIPLLNNKLS